MLVLENGSCWCEPNKMSDRFCNNKRYLANTNAGVINATMPIVNLSVGDSIEIADGAQNWNINNVILTSASHQFKDAIGNIDDGPVNLDVSGITVMLLWTGSYWRIIS